MKIIGFEESSAEVISQQGLYVIVHAMYVIHT